MTRRQACAAMGLMAGRLGLAAGSTSRIQHVRLPGGAIQPQVAVGADGVFHVVYYLGDARSGDLFYARSNDWGATLSQALPVNTSGTAIAAGTIRGAQLALGRNGRVHVAWNGSSKSQPKGVVNPDSGKPGEPMLYTRLNDAGTGFEPQRNLMLRTFGLDGGGSVAADRQGNVYVTWHGISEEDTKGAAKGEARRQVWVAESHDDGRSFAREKKAWNEPMGACACCGVKTFTDHEGTVYALYRSATESVHRDIYLLRSIDHGGTFDGRLLHKWEINACPMSSADFAENGKTLVAAWETGGQVYWAPIRKGIAGRPVAAPGAGKGRKHPRLALNGNGELLFVWTEGMGWQRGGSLAWQLYSPSGEATSEKGQLTGVPAWSFAAPAARPDGSFSIIS